MLVILAGLPGMSKTTIARAFCAKHRAAYVRVDAIEQALLQGSDREIGTEGYRVAYAIAASNLGVGMAVVADSVNPVAESRNGWREVARRAATRFLEVEIVCSDGAEHRRRVEARVADIAGHALPSWEAVMAWAYAPWPTDRLVIDTAQLSVEAAVARIEKRIAAETSAAQP